MGAQDKNILVVGATNMFDSLDPAVIDRIKFSAYVGLPKEEEIEKLLAKEFGRYKMGKNLADNEEELKKISRKLVGYSPRSIVNMVSQAFEYAWEESRQVTRADIEKALIDGNYEKINEEDYMPKSRKRPIQIGIKY